MVCTMSPDLDSARTDTVDTEFMPFAQSESPNFSTFVGPSVAACHVAEEIQIDGDAKFGTVKFLGQIHTTYTETEKQLEDIGRFQAAILSYLRNSEIKDVFVEGQFKDLHTASNESADIFAQYHYWLLPAHLRKDKTSSQLLAETRQIFSELSSPDGPTTEQAVRLGALGAAFVYAATTEDVVLHRTISATADAALYEKQGRLKFEDPLNRRYCFDVRERIATNELNCFLKNNPGSNVALIFGTQHDFKEDFQWRWESPPVLIRVHFPEAYRAASQALGSSGTPADHQE
jgi:hypothetical protein